MPHLTVLLDTSPLQTGSQVRGIGTYTRLLHQHLAQLDQLEVIPITTPSELRQYRRQAQPDPKQTILHYPFFDLFFSTLPIIRPYKTVVTVHDVIPLLFPAQYPPGKKGRLRFYKQVFALQTVDAVITDSAAAKLDIINHLHLRPEKVFPVHLAGQPEIGPVPHSQQQQLRQQYQLPERYVLYVGDINYNKNIPQLLKMLKYLPPDLHLVCVGKNFRPQDIPEWQWITTQLALSDVEQRVHFFAEITTNDATNLAAIYAAAEAYIQPSLAEGFGLPVLEAMQAQTPVVSSNHAALREVAGTHALLVEPTAEALAAAVAEVLHWSKSHRQQVVQAAEAWAQQYRWAKTAAETLAVYQQVLQP